MEDRFSQQIKKGALGLLALKLVCDRDRYGYALQKSLAEVSQGEGRTAPKKVYTATDLGRAENCRRQQAWGRFCQTVDTILKG